MSRLCGLYSEQKHWAVERDKYTTKHHTFIVSIEKKLLLYFYLRMTTKIIRLCHFNYYVCVFVHKEKDLTNTKNHKGRLWWLFNMLYKLFTNFQSYTFISLSIYIYLLLLSNILAFAAVYIHGCLWPWDHSGNKCLHIFVPSWYYMLNSYLYTTICICMLLNFYRIIQIKSKTTWADLIKGCDNLAPCRRLLYVTRPNYFVEGSVHVCSNM